MESMWVVAQYAGDFNLFIFMKANYQVYFIYVFLQAYPRRYAKEDHYPTVGDILLVAMEEINIYGHKISTLTYSW